MGRRMNNPASLGCASTGRSMYGRPAAQYRRDNGQHRVSLPPQIMSFKWYDVEISRVRVPHSVGIFDLTGAVDEIAWSSFYPMA